MLNLNKENIGSASSALAKSTSDVLQADTDEFQNSKSLNKTHSGNFSRDEMNLAEFPLAVLSTRNDPKIKTLEFSDQLRNKDGEIVERKWIITGADKFGLPTSTDDDVILGLIRLSMNDGFRERKVYFTRYELLKALKWSTEGRNYSRLTKSLDRLSGVRIRASNSFYDNTTKSYQTCNFGIIDAYEINDNRGLKNKDTQSIKSYFTWSEMIYQSFHSGFIKKIDLDLYFKLKSAVSRRLYRYLDKHFYYRNVIERPIMNFAFEKLGLSRTYKYVSSIRQQIEPAADELVEMGFLSKYEITGKGELTHIRFIAANQHTLNVSLNHKATSEQEQQIRPETISETKVPNQINSASIRERRYESKASNPLQSSTEHKSELRNQIFEAIVSRGIVIRQAKRLLENKSERELVEIDRILQYYDFLVESNDIKVSKNKVGFLYRAVENPYKFAVPASSQNLKQNSAKSLESSFESATYKRPEKRPELRVFNSKQDNSAQESKLKQEQIQYRDFIDKQLAEKVSLISQDELEKINQNVEHKMNCLKSVLTPERFVQAHSSCVREELIKRLNLADFKTWQKNI